MNMRLMATVAWLGLCVLVACGGRPESPTPQQTTIRLAKSTASDLGEALKRVPEVHAQVVPAGGSSIISLTELREGKTDIIVPVADVAYLAYAGQLEEMPQPFSQLRGMAVTDLNALHLLVSRKAHVRSLSDLKGRKVSLGAPGSSTALITARMLEAYGLGAASYFGGRVPNAELVERLANGELDAAFNMFIPPNQSVKTVMQDGNLELIDIDGPIVEGIRTQYPYLRRTLIAAGTYPNQPNPVRTIGVDVIMVCRADLADEVVYRLLDAYFATLPAMTPPNLERAPATPIPLHPGAARFYRQRELAR